MLWVYGFSLGFSLGCICICPLMHFGYMILVIKRETGHLILQGWYKLHTYVSLPHFAVILSTMFLQIITEEGNEFAVDVLEFFFVILVFEICAGSRKPVEHILIILRIIL